MATILDKDLIRESTVKFNDREIQVTLTADQNITFKLKGMKSGMLTISIDKLYKQLAAGGGDDEDEEEDDVIVKPAGKAKVPVKQISFHNKKSGDYDGGPMIPLGKLKSMAMATKMEMATKIELQNVISELINEEVSLV